MIVLSLFTTVSAAGTLHADEVLISKIWDAAPHNAFTDIIRWNHKFCCTFRTGTGHVPGDNGEDGKIQVLMSEDGQTWESIAHLAEPEVDLRDPKLSITPDGRLMVLMGGSYYNGRSLEKRNSRVVFLRPGDKTFSEITPIVVEPEIAQNDQWLWRVTWHDGTGYGVIYQPQRNPWGLQLVKTQDGIHYQRIKTLSLPGRPNESTVRFTADGEMRIVVRNEGNDAQGHLGMADAPYTDFTWYSIPHRLGGPNMIQLPDGAWILGTRQYSTPTRTVIGVLADTGEFTKLYAFPSAGDTSYPGLLVQNNLLWVSYYASHEGRTSIYLARVPLEALADKIRGKE